jgi:hypothetical protein
MRTKWFIRSIGLALTAALAACQPFEGDTTNINTPDQNIMYASISGQLIDNTSITNGSGGSTDDGGIAGATVTALTGTGLLTTTTDASGYWYFTNIPYRARLDNSSEVPTDRGVTVAASHDAYDRQSVYMPLWGHWQASMSAKSLKWRSNVVHGTGNTSRAESYSQGDTNAHITYYLSDNTSNITVSFNMPVDTSYATDDQVFELYDPAGNLVSFAGSWDSGQTTYTVDPADSLTCTKQIFDRSDISDSYEFYRLRLIKEVRSFNYSTIIRGLDGGNFIDFRVLCDVHGELLVSVTPQLAPELDSTSGISSYRFDANGVHYLNASGDFLGGINTSFTLKWPAVNGAYSYRLYFRMFDKWDRNDWTQWASAKTEGAAPSDPEISENDGEVRVTVSGLFGLTGFDLDRGKEVQFVATAINADGMESPIGSTTPLTIEDEHGPSLNNATVSAGTTVNSEYASATFMRELTLDFTEDMDTSSDASITLTKVGNNVASVSENGIWGWNDRSTWEDSALVVALNVPSTTLDGDILTASSVLKVTSTSTFLVGDTVRVLDTSGLGVDGTIQDIHTENNQIFLTGNLTPTSGYKFADGATVYLVDRSGLTAWRTTLAGSNPQQGQDTINVSDATGFFAGQSLVIYNVGNDGNYSSTDTTSVTISSISGNALTLTAQLPRDLQSGSLVLDGSALYAEPAPRSETNAGPSTEEVIWDTSTASTTIRSTSEYNDANPTVILVDSTVGTSSDTTNFEAGDWVTIAASTASTTLNGNDNASDAKVTVASTADFREGDKVVIHGEVVSVTLTDDHPGTLDGDNTLRNGTSNGASPFTLIVNDDGGSGDNHTLRSASATSLLFSGGDLSDPRKHVVDGATVTFTDAAVSTTLNASMTSASDNLSLTSTLGLAEGQTLTLSSAALSTTTSVTDNLSAGVDNLTVASTAGMAFGQKLTLDNGTHTATRTIDAVPNAITVTLAAGTAINMSSGNTVTRGAFSDNVTIASIASASNVDISGNNFSDNGTHAFGATVTRAEIEFSVTADFAPGTNASDDNVTWSAVSSGTQDDLSDAVVITVEDSPWYMLAINGGTQVLDGDSVSISDAEVVTTLAATVARDQASDNISLASTAGLAVGQSLKIFDGADAEDTVTITGINSTTSVEVSGITTDTTEPYFSGARVVREAVTINDTVAADSTTSLFLDSPQTNSISNAATVTVTRPYLEMTVDNVTSATVLEFTGTPAAPHRSGAAVTLVSYPEVREITAVGTYSLTLNSALDYSHHTGAAVTKVATGLAEFSGGAVDNVLVGDVVVIDLDGNSTTTLDRIEGEVLQVLTQEALVRIRLTNTTTDVITDDASTDSRFYFLGDAVKVTGASDGSGNAQQTGYGQYNNLNTGDNPF